VLGIFDRIKVPDPRISDWFLAVLRARGQATRQRDEQQLSELRRQRANLQGQRERLLNLRLQDQVDEATFTEKSAEIRDRVALLDGKLSEGEASERVKDMGAVEKFFELSQTLRER
jgi:hypothetical protein